MKQYNGEKAIISLTSWKARINTVGLTLFSLYKRCPGFHIVLVLSEEEFPQKEAELPDSVMAFVDQDLIELLWVYKNTKSFKKVLPTMEKYKGVPVISADDDYIYTYNYAKELYNVWINNKPCVITETSCKLKDIQIPYGYATLYPPNFYTESLAHKIDYLLSIDFPHDDLLYGNHCKLQNIHILTLNNKIEHLTKTHINQLKAPTLYKHLKKFNPSRMIEIINNCFSENVYATNIK